MWKSRNQFGKQNISIYFAVWTQLQLPVHHYTMNMSYVLIHIIHKASVNHPRAAAPSGPAYYRGHADSGAADKRIKDLARLSVLITYNTPINYTHTADHSPPLNHWPAAGNDKCFLFAIFSSLIIIVFIGTLSVFFRDFKWSSLVANHNVMIK